MRFAVLLILLLTAACDGGTTAPSSTTPAPAVPPSTPSSAAPAVLTWGGSGTSSDVLITLNAPKASADPVIGADGKPDPAQRYVLIPGTADNKSSGKATLSFGGRVGQKEAPPVAKAGDDLNEFLAGESGAFEQRFRVPADATELVLEVYANVNQEPTDGRLQFKGPLPPVA
jgi:hypothetical protein